MFIGDLGEYHDKAVLILHSNLILSWIYRFISILR